MILNIKKSYKILGFHDQCPTYYMQKLFSFGFLPGNTFFIKQKALFGNTYQINIQNCAVLVRKEDLLLLQIEEI